MRLLIAPILAGVLAGVPAAAHAGGYVSVGVGPEAELSGDFATQFQAEDLTTARLAIGYRSRNLAVEAVGLGTGLDYMGAAENGSADLESASLGVNVKYYLDLFLGLEAYGRAGLHRTWLGEDLQEQEAAYEGSGHVLGGGLEYGFDVVPVIAASIWVDYSRQTHELADAAQRPLSGTADVVTIGVSLGL